MKPFFQNKFFYLCLAELAERGYKIDAFPKLDKDYKYSAIHINYQRMVSIGFFGACREIRLSTVSHLEEFDGKNIIISTKKYRWYDKFMEELELL